MSWRKVVDWKLMILGIATLMLAISYGLYMTNMLLSDDVSMSELAAAVMGAAVLLGMALGTMIAIEVRQFVEAEE